MKKSMKKFIVACAAVSAITAAAGMSAMAAEYNAENNSVAITVPAEAAVDTQKTILVIPQDKETSVTDADIYYINQDADLGTTALLKGDSLADGTYVVKIGYYKADGTFAIANDSFTVGNDTPVKTILIGDVDLNKRITTNDASKILAHTSKVETLTGDPEIAARKCDGNERITANDASEILKYTSKISVEFVGTTVTVE